MLNRFDIVIMNVKNNKMKLRIFLLFLICHFTGVVYPQQNFQNTFKSFVSQDDYKNAWIGMQVADVESGEILFEFNPRKLLIPASNLKLATSAAALEMLGEDYRFQTKIGYSGTLENGILTGDLVLIGGGDPTLGSEYFAEEKPDFLNVWTEKIRQAGISNVRGNLVLDASAYDSEKIPPTWIWEDLGNYYGAGPGAFTVYDNLFRITFRSPNEAGKKTEIMSVYPKIPGLQLKNEVLSDNSNWDHAYVFGGPFDLQRVVRGTIPKNRNEFTIKAAMPFPEKILAEKLIQYLENAGVSLSGTVKFEKVSPEGFHEIFVQKSPTLAEIIKVTNHESVNLFAEHLVKQIALEKNGTGNRENGIELIQDFWNKSGIDKDSYFMEDGSGLSHFDAVSPEVFVKILLYMANKSPHKETFFNSLPSPGEGTLYYFDTSYFPGNSLKVKSGSMTRVRCYSGYLQLNSGKQAAFSIMVNQFKGGHAKVIREIERLLFQIKKSF